MIKRFLALSSGIVALFSIAVFPAFAASVTGSTAVNTATNLGSAVSETVTGSNGSGSATVTVGTGNSGVGVTVSGNTANATNSGSVGIDVGDSVTSSSSTDTVNLTSSDATVMNYSGNSTVTPDPTQVASGDDLNTYAEATMHSDSNIQNVQLSNNAVLMTYNEPGKLFGFIPVSINAKAQVNASGNVVVTYPWYHFLVSTNNVNLTSDLQTRVQSTMNNNLTASASASANDSGSGSASMNGQLSARTQAELMADLEAGFSGAQ